MKPGEDPALDAIKEAARSGDRLADPRWEALSRGELSPEAQAELRQADPEAFEALRPLDAEAAARILDAIGPPQAKVIPLRPRWRAPAAVFAIAASVVLAVYLGTRPAGPVPEYALEVTGGEREVRGGTGPRSQVIRLTAPDSRLELRLRPATEVRGKVDWFCAFAEPLHAWIPRPPGRVTPDGTIVIAGTRQELFPDYPEGTRHVFCRIGRPESMHQDQVDDRIDPPPGTQQLHVYIQLGDAP